MPRLTFFVLGTALGWGMTTAHSATLAPGAPSVELRAPSGQRTDQVAIRNVLGLLAAVRELPPVVCGLTAEAASGWGGKSVVRRAVDATRCGDRDSRRLLPARCAAIERDRRAHRQPGDA